MTAPGKPNDAGQHSAKWKPYIVPAVGVLGVVVLVVLVISISGESSRKMSDGSDGTAGDPKLQEVASGVRVRDIKEGTGEPCPKDATVTLHYTGWLESGEVFESSRARGVYTTSLKPGTRRSEIEGWSIGIPGMKKGGIRKLVVSPEKGFGTYNRQARRPGGLPIPGNATLIYEIELVEFAPPKNVVSGPGQPMPSDKSNGGTDDPGLKDLGDGLKYRDLKEGTGEPVKEGADVVAHYTGWTVDGNVFDSSHRRGQPTPFSLKEVVRGWQRGIPGMKPGGVRKLVIPAALGYGEDGRGDEIPGGATLIFEVELVK